MATHRVEAVAISLQVMLLAAAGGGGGEWVDYPSGAVRCCSDIPVERCDPRSPDANAACRDVCHYGGCRRGGQCEDVDGNIVGRFCHCNC